MTPILLAAAGRIHPLATTNAVLNSLAAVLLVAGWVLIRRGQWRAHRAVMLAAFATSAVFLVSYLVYHALEGSRTYTGPESLRLPYYVILATHVVLAAAVPVLAVRMFFLAWRGRWDAHRRLGRVTMPIWLYVSVTGVVIYAMLYHLPAAAAPPAAAVATGL
ncbi:MAG: DUF420 domain-containing protein [Planctomycetes bacterium]|nr:DUF420 domain-containing protein [Planctomycetota bacterium]